MSESRIGKNDHTNPQTNVLDFPKLIPRIIAVFPVDSLPYHFHYFPRYLLDDHKSQRKRIMRANLEPTTSPLGDQNPDVSSEHLTGPNMPTHRVMTGIEQEELDDLAETLETSYTRLKAVGTQLDNLLTTVPKDMSALETYNHELGKIDAELSAKYKTALETVSELQAGNRALKEGYKRLEAIVTESCDRTSSLAASTAVQTAENIWWNEDEIEEIYAEWWKRSEDVETRTPLHKAQKICAESWNRNEIIEARVPVKRPNADANPDTNANADNIPHKDQFDARSLELCCDCGVTFKVAGGKLNSIKVKHNTNKPDNRRAKLRKTTTVTEARNDDSSPSPLALVRSRSEINDTKFSDMAEFYKCMFLLCIFIPCVVSILW